VSDLGQQFLVSVLKLNVIIDLRFDLVVLVSKNSLQVVNVVLFIIQVIANIIIFLFVFFELVFQDARIIIQVTDIGFHLSNFQVHL
jgi:hypothetical protein